MWLQRYRPVFAPDETSGGGGGPPATASAPSSATSPTQNSTAFGPGSNAPSAPAGPSGAPSTPGAQSAPKPMAPASTEAPPAAAPSTQEEQFDFDSIFGGDWYPEAKPKPPVAPAAVPPPEPPPAAPVVPPPVAAPPSAPDGAPQAPAPEGQSAPSRDASSRPLDPGDLSGMAAALMRNRDGYIDHLAANQFALSPEDVANLEADVTTSIPRLLARTQVDTMVSLLTHMGRSVPLMVQRYMEVSKARTEAEGAFYSRWPDIDQAKHAQLVQQYAVTLRAMHPQMSTQEMIEKVGPMVMMAAQIVPDPSRGQKRPASGAVAPQAAASNGSHPPQPFVPALPGTAHAAPVPDPNDNYGWMGQNE